MEGSRDLPAVVGVIGIEFGELEALGTLVLGERVRVLLLLVGLHFLVEHGHLLEEVGAAALTARADGGRRRTHCLRCCHFVTGAAR